MAVPGTKPKDGNKRFRGQALTEWTEVEDTPFDGDIPDLPDLPDGDQWPEQTKKWYEVVSTLPHAILWDAGEWEFIITTAMLHAAIWRNPADPHTSRLAELRQREKQLGLTADHRRDLRIRYVEPKPILAIEPPKRDKEQTATVTPILSDLRPRQNALGS